MLSAVLLLCILPVGAFAISDPPSQAGPKVIAGKKDFLWPVPGQYNLTSCFLDNREHYSLDIDGEKGNPVIASYAGTVKEISTENKSTGWGNYVLLEHNYTTDDGKVIVLYSRYAHLQDVLVAAGDSVTRGQDIGTVGATGSVNTATGDGSHLDYDILYGGTEPSSTYSVDPFINELLELPPEVYTTSGNCCQEYVEYIHELYNYCSHNSYDKEGFCTDCGEEFDWYATKKETKEGYYTAANAMAALTKPYATADGAASLSADEEVMVYRTVTNAAKEIWYEIETMDGFSGYVPKAALKFASYFESEITGELTTLTEGQVLKPEPHRLEGKIVSRYPLKKVVGYLDGKWCGSWAGDGKTRELTLHTTDINTYVSFGKLSTGEHKLVITATDTTGREAFQVISCTFYIARDEDMITITYAAESQEQTVSVVPGQALGELPTPQLEGGTFLGWFTDPDEGDPVTEKTIPTEDITLYPHWEMAEYTVTFENQILTIPHGGFITEFPECEQEGYVVAGWITSEGKEITATTPITSDLTLYPKWELKGYVLTLDTKGGKLSETEVVVRYGEPYGELPTPTRKGYDFLGWRQGGKVLSKDDVVLIAGDHTAVAVWEKSKANIPWLLIILIGAAVLVAGAVVTNYVLRSKETEEDWD